FVAQLARVARKALFVSTPNFALSRNAHPYHVREYAPHELLRLFSGHGEVRLFGGTSTGQLRQEIKRRCLYLLLNVLYTFKITLIPAKILKRLLLIKLWAHHAVFVTLPDGKRDA